MAFSLSRAASGAIGGAGTGSMFGGVGAGVGAGIGGLIGGFSGGDTDYSMSPEQQALLQNQLGIASGSIEAPEVQQLKQQSNRIFAQQVGAMGNERGATAGAKSAFIQNLGAQNQAQTNEAAAAEAARARQRASINAANMMGRQQGYNIQSQNAAQNEKSRFLGSMAQLGAYGASQYLDNSGNKEWLKAINQ